MNFSVTTNTKTDNEDESERSDPTRDVKTPSSTLKVRTRSLITSNVSAITQSSIDESQMKKKSGRKRRKVSNFYNDDGIERPKKEIASIFNIEEVREDKKRMEIQIV